ncbi:L,D-transpeptidase [Thermoflexus sp.]|uniref:L,D-transpeptidase n=1 Tax=Thermoflexus sp. TaxID=1969742 RepID=UPI002ADE3B28|nr:L,D-transpeptidase family protein [Thermoflexus sp.]
MGASARSPELKALRWARRALQAASPEEALWWAAQAYAAAPASPPIRAVVRRIRRRFPNARGRPPARWPRWMIGVGFLYGLSVLMAVFLIAWGLGALDPWTSQGEGELPPLKAMAIDSTPDAVADLRGDDSEDAISEVRAEGPTPTATLPPATSTPTPSPSPRPTLPSSPTPTPRVAPTRTPRPTATMSARPRPAVSPTPWQGPPFPSRWILVDLSDQELTAYEGETSILRTKVSTGRPRTPTVIGIFRIYLKLRAQTMTGPGYRLPNVPYVMYFYRGYALHGTYWHNNFGRPMSHGCVNLPTPIAEQLYYWADIGTPVVVQP